MKSEQSSDYELGDLALMTPRRGPSVVSQRVADTSSLAERYGELWNAHDLEAIVGMHSADSIFQLHLPGSSPVDGRQAVRESFAGFLAQLPDLRFTTKWLYAGLDHWVNESMLTGTVTAPLELDGEELDAPDTRVEVACVDVVAVRDGLVARKSTYLDALTFLRQLGLA